MFKKKTQIIAAVVCSFVVLSATACSKTNNTSNEVTPTPVITEAATGEDTYVAAEDDAIVEGYIVQLTGDEAEDMYQKGTEKYDKEYYPSAVDCFKQIYAYKDSMQKLKDSLYQSGLKNFEKESYERALSYFNQIPKYQDSAEKLNECYYVLGVAAFDEEKFSEAKELLSLADPSYKDVSSYLDKISE